MVIVALKNLPETNMPHVIRFKNPIDGIVSFSDEVYGDIHIQIINHYCKIIGRMAIRTH